MQASALWPYRSPAAHEAVSEIIRRRSTNPLDIREFALSGLDLSGARHVLDLGCGFGFTTEVLAHRVAPGAHITGVDACSSDEEPFLERVRAAERRGSFVRMHVRSRLPWPDGFYDAIVCCYALYFFVEALPEIARVLAPGGVFVALTHSEASIAGHLPQAGFGRAVEDMLAIARRFSAENGREVLGPWFESIQRADYPNALVFEREHGEELLAYLRFKLPLLVPGAKTGDELPPSLESFVQDTLETAGRMVIDKNDAVFHCRRPQWR